MKSVLLFLTSLLAISVATHVGSTPDDMMLDEMETTRSHGSIARATVPPEYVCELGSNAEHFYEYTNDRESRDRVCDFTLIDMNAQFFLPITGRVLEFYDRGIPMKAGWSNKTIGGARSITFFPALGIVASIVESTYISNGRSSYEQGQECSVPDSFLQLSRRERRRSPDVITLDRSFSVTDNLDVALSQSSNKVVSSDGQREFYDTQYLNFAQVEQKRIVDVVTGEADAFTLNLVLYNPVTHKADLLLSGYCDAGVQYTQEDFYNEFPSGVIPGASQKRDEGWTMYGSIGSIPWADVASEQNS